MSRWLFVLFVVGLVAAVIGWFFDKGLEVQWFARLTVPDYVYGTDALDRLEQNERFALLPAHPGFDVLLDRWPRLERKSDVRQIARSIAYMDFGAKVTPEIELIARNDRGEEIPPRWQVSLARKQILDEANHRLFWVGTVVFFAGIALSAAAGVIEFLSDERNERK